MASRWQVLNVYSVVLALQLMFATPVEGSIMNAMAAEQLQADPKLFEQHVRDTLQGGQYFGLDFICNMADGEGMAIQTHQRSWAPAERHSDHMHKVPPSLPPFLPPSLLPSSQTRPRPALSPTVSSAHTARAVPAATAGEAQEQ